MYGPAAQLLGWLATAFTATGSPLDAYGMIVFFFCASTVGLVAGILLLSDRISWQQSAVFYGSAIFLNLFFDVLDLRIAGGVGYGNRPFVFRVATCHA
jgi:hypothetical protein